MMFSKKSTIVWLLVVFLMLPGLAMAVKKGRLIGKVVDPEGNAIVGVTVVATCAEVSSYKAMDESNNKGIFKIDFDDLAVVYTLKFVKDGYLSFTSDQTYLMKGKKRETFVMYPGSNQEQSVVLATSSDPAIQAYNDGVAAFNREDYDTAATKFEEALSYDPSLYSVWSALSRVRLAQERYQEAAEAAEKAIELGSTSEAPYRRRWEAYRKMGDEEKALEALKDLEDAGIRAAEAQRLHNEAVALTKANDYEGAYVKFKEALDLGPNLIQTQLGIALSAQKIGRYSESINAAEAVLESDAQNEQAIRLRYNAALDLGETDRIIDALVTLAAVEPEIARDNLLVLAFESYDGNEMVAAEQRFKKVLEVDPGHPHSHYLLALIYVNDGRNEQAKPHLERFLALAPDDPEARTAGELLKYLNEGS